MESEGSAPAHLDLILQALEDEGQEASRPVSEPRPGALCPKCRESRLDYDGLLNLTCPNCGYTAGGCFT